MPRAKIILNKERLKKLYVDKNYSPYKIGVQFGCSFATVRNRLKEYNIPFKDPAFARQRSSRADFDGSDSIKAYMIGFRIGDLNVYRPSEKSQTIVVRCHTTQYDQIRVIKSLFKKYGQVTISLKNGHYHINCFLNHSFMFLLPKNETAWEWLKKATDKEVASFIAGYNDAEGNFVLNQNRARFKIDSYDKDLLEFISMWLSSKNINNKFRRIYKMGDVWNGKYPLNKDLWRLNINDMVSLERFIKLMMLIIRHKKRMRDMLICHNNIQTRQSRKKRNE